MPAISARVPKPPIEVLKDAIAAAHERGLRVRVGDPGVVFTSTHGAVCWELDPDRHEDAVDPLGALLLSAQPRVPGAVLAATVALGEGPAWVEGLRDGLELARPDALWMASGRRHLYSHGRESGVLLRLHVASFPSGGGRPTARTPAEFRARFRRGVRS